MRILITAVFIILFSQTVFASSYSMSGDATVCLNFKYDRGAQKEALKRGLKCSTSSANPYQESNQEKNQRLEKYGKTSDVGIEKRKAEAQQKALLAAQARLDSQKAKARKSLALDRCLLRVFEAFPDHNLDTAKYLCNSAYFFIDNGIATTCLLDRGANQKKLVIDAAFNVCANTAVNPSAMDIVRYNNPLGKFFKVFD